MDVTGYFIDCDTALCTACFRPEAWEGFEDWDEPSPIFESESVDCPTHCAECETLLTESFTDEGVAYIMEALATFTADPLNGRLEILETWRDAVSAYSSDFEREDWEILAAFDAVANLSASGWVRP